MMLLSVLTILSQWLAPIPGAEISAGFAPPEHTWSAGHRGVDYATAAGEQVRAIGPGVVVYVGQIAGKPVISIEHSALGLKSTYEPVVASVRKGEQVMAGDIIGVISRMGGHCAGACLHLGLKAPGVGEYRNPLDLFERGFAVLKPLSG